MELNDCSKHFQAEEKYTLPHPLNFTWHRVDNPELCHAVRNNTYVYVLKSLYRPIVVMDLMTEMMKERSFDGILRLWFLPEQTNNSQ